MAFSRDHFVSSVLKFSCMRLYTLRFSARCFLVLTRKFSFLEAPFTWPSKIIALIMLSGWLCSALSYGDTLEQRLRETTQLLPTGTSIAAVIQPLGNRDEMLPPIIIDGHRLLSPASTLKIITAIAAYRQLGKEFRFITQLRKEPDGDWVLVFSGDPLLTSNDIKKLLQQTKGQGITTIDGDLILDDSLFNGHWWSAGQSWDDQSLCFGAPVTALNLHGNCVYGLLYIDRLNTIAKPHIPRNEPINIISQARVVAPQEKTRRFCDLELTHDYHNNYKLHGCITPQDQPLTLALAIVDPTSYMKEIVRHEASLLNIVIKGDIRIGKASTAATLLAEHQSPSIAHYLEKMLAQSDNVIADTLFKMTGHSYFNYPGNYRNGTAAVREILHEQLEIDLANAYIADGSGLSRYNLISPVALATALTYITTMDHHVLLDAFAVSGVNGTLESRYPSLAKPPLKGVIKAKTGTLKGVYNLAGFMESANGEPWAFVLFIDGFNLPTEAANGDAIKNRTMERIDAFYQQFFTILYHTGSSENS